VNNPHPTLIGVQQYLTDERLKQKDSAMQRTMFNLGGLAEEAAALLSQSADDTIGGIMSNALLNMAWLKSAGMTRMLCQSDFKATDINNGHTTVYFVLPPDMLVTHERVQRLMANTFLNAAFKGRKSRKHAPTVFYFDEAAGMGSLTILPKCLSILRNYGARAVMIYQYMGQIIRLFGEDSKAFFANAGQVQVFALNDDEGQKYVEARIGARVLWRKKVTKTQWGDVVEYEPSAAFSLRNSDEVGRSTGRSSGLQIVLNEGGDPFLLRRTPYTKMFKKHQYDPDPYEPAQEGMLKRAFERIFALLGLVSRT
jgi:type IV secretory pathway TraG/TraD family ATPase VirD4